MRTLTGLFVFAVLALSLVGCKPANKLVGSWIIGDKNGITITFNPNLTFEASASSSRGSALQDGTYTVDGNSLTITTTKMELKATDPAQQKQIDDMMKPLIAAFLNKPQEVNISWSGDNQFSIASGGGMGSPMMKGMTLKRK